jgi:hypothetical protein
VDLKTAGIKITRDKIDISEPMVAKRYPLNDKHVSMTGTRIVLFAKDCSSEEKLVKLMFTCD